VKAYAATGFLTSGSVCNSINCAESIEWINNSARQSQQAADDQHKATRAVNERADAPAEQGVPHRISKDRCS
jgi:hypothetical protein